MCTLSRSVPSSQTRRRRKPTIRMGKCARTRWMSSTHPQPSSQCDYTPITISRWSKESVEDNGRRRRSSIRIAVVENRAGLTKRRRSPWCRNWRVLGGRVGFRNEGDGIWRCAMFGGFVDGVCWSCVWCPFTGARQDLNHWICRGVWCSTCGNTWLMLPRGRDGETHSQNQVRTSPT